MRILACVSYHYYNNPRVVEPTFIYFTKILEQMGHQVHSFDFFEQANVNRDRMNDFFLSTIKNGKYDLVIIVTHKDEFYVEALEEAKKHSILVAWNSDDDWRWEDYSSKWCKHYTYMVTTYRHIYEENKAQYANLLLSQWGCSGLYDGWNIKKNIDFSFVGQIYGDRLERINYIQKKMILRHFGQGYSLNRSNLNWKNKIKRTVASIFRIPWDIDDAMNFDSVNEIWNSSKISYTPLQSSLKNSVQIKSRVFDMGLSGTVMLCDKNADLSEFYQPGKEYMEFETLDECIDKAKYLLKNETERNRIAEAYYKRTQAEHLWVYRFKKLFLQIY